MSSTTKAITPIGQPPEHEARAAGADTKKEQEAATVWIRD